MLLKSSGFKRLLASRWVWGLAGTCLVLLYLPPIGQTIALPDIEPFLEPGVPHAAPTFIHTGHHVYYRVRLHRPVAPWFAWTYFKRLRARGLRFADIGTSPFGPAPRRTGWRIGMTREKTIEPYTIEYWKSEDRESAWFPISLRWPWLYVRLGPQVALPPLTAILTPPAMPLRLAPFVPQVPGARLIGAGRSQWRVELDFWVAASGDDVRSYYQRALESNEPMLSPRDYDVSGRPAPALAKLGARAVRVDVDNYLYTDHPVIVYPRDQLPAPEFHDQQPEGLIHLPNVSKFGIIVFFVSEDAAQRAWEQIVLSKDTRGAPLR